MLKKPDNLPPDLVAIWDEFEGQFRDRIGSAGLESLCSAVNRMRRARTRIDAEGEIVADPKGNPTPHPALAIERASAAEVRNWVLKFGGRQ